MKSNNQTQPVFILGSARSGTTWLANILESHPQIAAMACKEHHGIHESHLYDHTLHCFPEFTSCQEFLDRYKEEDYFKLLNLSIEKFCHDNRDSVHTVPEWFRLMMDAYSVANSALCWVEKTPKHAIYFNEIVSDFPDVRFVTIARSFRETLLSNLTKYARPNASRVRQIAEKVFRYEFDRKALKKLNGKWRDRSLSITYESLVKDNDAVIADVERFLGVDVLPLKSKYEADSSFTPATKKYRMNRFDWMMAYTFKFFFALLPYRISAQLRRQRDKEQQQFFPLFSRID